MNQVNSPALVSALMKILEAIGLSDLPGKSLYSGIGTIHPGKIYVLGENPGGDPNTESDSSGQHLTKLALMSPDWNEFLDANWTSRGRVYPPGGAPMQKRVRSLLEGIGLSVRSVCSSNLIFVRSRVSGDLVDSHQLANQCWPVHQFILEHIKPVGILCIGKAPFEFIRKTGRALSTLDEFSAGQRNLKCRTAHVDLDNRTVAIVSVPHLGDRLQYDIGDHPEVMRWVKDKLGL